MHIIYHSKVRTHLIQRCSIFLQLSTFKIHTEGIKCMKKDIWNYVAKKKNVKYKYVFIF